MSPDFLKMMGWMLAILLLMAPAITSELTADITTSKEAYLFGEPIEFTVTSATSDPLTVTITDPNGEATALRDCKGTCGYSYMPAIIVQGEYRISVGDGTSLRQARAIVTERPLTRPESERPERETEAPGEYVFVDIGEAMPEEETEIIMTAARQGATAEIIVEAPYAGESIAVTVTDSLGKVFVIEARHDGTRYTAPLETQSETITIEYAGTMVNAALPMQGELKPAVKHEMRKAEIITIKDSQDKDVSAKVRAINKGKNIEQTAEAKNITGEASLEVDLDDMIVKKMAFKNIDAANVTKMKLKIEDVPASVKKGAKQAYAIDPTGLDFSEAEVTATAAGEILMKCKEYDFDSRTCSGEWTFVMSITPGKNYTFILTPEDPIYAEMGITSVLDDAWVASNAATTVYNTASLQIRDRTNSRNRIYMRWDMSGLPERIHVTNAVLALYNRVDGTTLSASVYHVYDDSWQGRSESTLTWNTQPCGLLTWNTTACNIVAAATITSNAGWMKYNVTSMMQVEESTPDGKLSLMIRTPESTNRGADSYDSSETAQTTTPQLNVTYLLYPRVSLTEPDDTSTSYRNTVEFNYSAWDDRSKLNCTLYGNFSGPWRANKTIVNMLNNTARNFTLSLKEGSYHWNVVCTDKDGLSDNARTNRTIIVRKPGLSANQSNYLTAQAALISGATFPANANLTITFTDPFSVSVPGYPISILASPSGTFSRTWAIPNSAAGGTYTMTVTQANDSLVGATTSFIIQALDVDQEKTDYVREEMRNITAGSFTPHSDVTIRMTDPYLDPVAGYPKTVKANGSGTINDSWPIPAGADLGSYAINVTESAVPGRSKTATFSVVNAVIQASKGSYELGETANISGYAWDPLKNVTVNITTSWGTPVFGPFNLTANSSGMVNTTFMIGYGHNPGNYTLWAFAPQNPSKTNAYTFEVAPRTVSALSQYPWYRNGFQLNITGTGSSPGSQVTLSISNITGEITGFPEMRAANSTGGWNRTLMVSGLGTGLYTIRATDLTYPNLNTTSLFEIVRESAWPGKASYGTGEAVSISGTYWARSRTVTIRIENSTKHKVYSANVTAGSDGAIAHQFLAPTPSGSSEDFNATVYEPGSEGWSSFLFTVQYKASLLTNQSAYNNNYTAVIKGNYFTPSSTVTLTIVSNATKTNAEGYPKAITTNSTGGIWQLWNTSDYCLGIYSVRAVDQANPGLLTAEINFSIVEKWYTFLFDGFESGSMATNGWQEYETQAGSITITTNNAPKTGTQHLEIRGLNNWVNLTVDLRDKIDANVTFWWKGISMEAGEYVQLNIYDGFWHTDVMRWVDGQDTNTYLPASLTLEGYNLSNKITFQFKAVMSATNDYLYIDDFMVNAANRTSCREFDSARPNVTSVLATPSVGKIGRPVNLTAIIKDDRGLKETRAIVRALGSTVYNLSMSDHDGDSIYNITFTDTAGRGTYNVTFFTADTSNNINSSPKISFTITYDTLWLGADKGSYIALETAYLTGTGFDAMADINLTFTNATGHAMIGYPKTIQSSVTGSVTDSWIIPSGTELGDYVFNATQVSAPGRSATTTISVVAAVILMGKESYTQGEHANISGYNWDASTAVSINITDAAGTLLYGPTTIDANATGEINHTWQAGYGITPGTYILFAFEPSDHQKYDSFTFEVLRMDTSLAANHPWYKEDELMNLTGSGFAPGSDVAITLSNATGILSGYPAIVKVNSSGGINLSIVVSGSNLGNYSAYAEDTSYPNLNATEGFAIVKSGFVTDKETYGTGENIIITGTYWDREKDVTINVTNSTGHVIISENITSDTNGNVYHAIPAPMPNGSMENFTIKAHQDLLYDDIANITVFLKATLSSRKISYPPMALVDLTGRYFTYLDQASLTVKSLLNGGTAEGYPVFLATDAQGTFVGSFNASTYCSGSYTAVATDASHPDTLQANATFTIDYDVEAFQNAELNYGRYMNWTWLPNRDSVGCGNSVAHANYNLRGVFTLDTSNNSFFAGSWKQSPNLPLAAGGSEEAIVTTNGGDLYNGMMMTSPTRIPANTVQATFWAYGYYLSGETNTCTGGDRYAGTLNSTPNNDRAEYIGFALWIDENGDTMNNTNIADDHIIFESHQSRIEAGTANFEVPPQTYTVDVGVFAGKRIYLTGTVTGTGGVDDAIIEMDGIRFIFDETGCKPFDIVRPNVTSVRPLGASLAEVFSMVNISAIVEDDRSVLHAHAIVNYPNTSIYNLTMTDPDKNSVYNVTFTPELVGDYQIRIFAQDNSTNVNASETTVVLVRDIRGPAWSSNRTSIVSGREYNPAAAYQFNMTWQDNYRMGTVMIEHNFSGSMLNYTVSSNKSDEWHHERGPIGAGTYRVTWYANDSSGNSNRSTPFSYTVARNSSAVILLLNGTDGNMTIQVHGAVSIQATAAEGEKPVTIRINGTASGTGYPTAINVTNFHKLGVYNITASHPTTRNYTGSWVTHWVHTSDTIAPTMTDILPVNATYADDNETVTFNATITDNYEVDSAWLRVWNRFIDMIFGLIGSGDNYGTEVILNESFVGSVNYSISANDTSGNVKTSKNMTLLVLGQTTAATDRQSYIRGEKVTINGTGFNLSGMVGVTVRNSTEIMTGFPKLVSTDQYGRMNASWTIPALQQLGTYWVLVNDTTTSRNASATFDIVTAVVEGQSDTLRQGEELLITGYNWDSGSSVGINITGPAGVAYGPKVLTANSTGQINDSYMIGYGALTGTYRIYAESGEKSDYYTFSLEKREVSVQTGERWYKKGETVNIIGSGFSPSQEVNITIMNRTGIESLLIAVSNSTGHIITSWTVEAWTALGYHNLTAFDTSYPNLNATTTFRTPRAEGRTDQDSYNNGDTVSIKGSFWYRSENVTVRVTNSTGHQPAPFPINLTSDLEGNITATWTAYTNRLTGSTYNVSFISAEDNVMNDTREIIVFMAATLHTDKDDYDQYEGAQVTGHYYTAGGEVAFEIRNTAYDARVPGFPKTLMANGAGDISTAWDTRNYCEGTYLLKAVDQTYPGFLNKEITVEIDYYDVSVSDETADGVSYTGNHGGSGGTVENSRTDDNTYLWFGGVDTAANVNAWMEFTFDLSSLGIAPEQVMNMSFTTEYCHSGVQSDPVCGSGPPHEGETNGPQMVEAYNYTSGSWVPIGSLAVDDLTPDEQTDVSALFSGFGDLVFGDEMRFRLEIDFNEEDSEDDMLVVDFAGLGITYRTDIVRPCLEIRDVMENVSDITKLPGMDVKVEFDGEELDVKRDYFGVRNITLYNGTTPLVRFRHDFNASVLNLTSITLYYENDSIAASVPGHELTLLVPMVNETCNVLVCEGVNSRDGCNETNNRTVYSDPVGGVCEVVVDGTWAQDQPDETDFLVTVADIFLPKGDYVEGRTIYLNVTVTNVGTTEVENLSVEVYDLTRNIRVNITNITYMGPESELTLRNIPWIAAMGNSSIEVRVDPFNEYQEKDESNNNASRQINVSIWQTYYGHIKSNLTIGSGLFSAYEWEVLDHTGNLYVAGEGVQIDWTNLQALGRTAADGAATDDFLEADQALGTAGAYDSILRTFGTDASTPKQTMTFPEVENREVANVPIANSTNTSTFVTGILWDMTKDTDGEFGGDNEDLVFVTRINEDTQGKYGVYDYEIRIPAYLREYGSATGEVLVYMSLD